ncbi:MAG: zinc dependent phospholipase C family protein [Blastocatellia bacterium]
MKKIIKRASRSAVLLAIMLSISQVSFGYSVLTHQAIIDSSWEDSIKPLVLKRFPGATAEQLKEAHAYSYGGAIIQDMGYYPFGSKFFSDLTHYVRSGDFIEALMAESQDINEYAFALGALAHYAADNNGHPLAVNKAVPVVYPKLRARYGEEVTYAEDPSAHMKTEFGFDVLQVARGRYAPESYHDFIGFKVSKDVLGRAFKKTYGLELKDVFKSVDLAIGSFRLAVSTIIPEATKVAWETKKDEIEKLTPGIAREKFVYNLSRAGYEKEWGKEYERPGPFAKTMAFLFRIVPKVGPFKAVAFKPPTPETEKMFQDSFNATLDRYRALLARAKDAQVDLQNRDFDTGQVTRAGEYRLADKTYAEWLDKLEDDNFKTVTPEQRANLLAFYGDLSAPIATKRNKGEWREVLQDLNKLKAIQAEPAQATRR